MKNKFMLLLFLCVAFSAYSQKQNVTIDDVWTQYKFHPQGIDELRSTSEGDEYTTLSESGKEPAIVAYSYATGKPVDTLLTGSQLAKAGYEMRIDDYELGKGEKNILISTKTESIYRHSTIAQYYVWNRAEKRIILLMDGRKVMYATLSPDGNSVAWVYKGDLYELNMLDYTDTPAIIEGVGDFPRSNSVRRYNTKRITTDGSDDVFNGVSDWVYEEEFVVTCAYFWSPDSKSIAYYRFDDSKVPVFSMNEYHDSLYPTVYSFRYPKAGTPNPSVAIKIYNIPNGTNANIIPTGSFEYIPRIKWTQSSSQLSNQDQGFQRKVMFGDRDKYPLWGGYTLGYRIVQSALKNNPNLMPSQWAVLPPDSILKMSSYRP